MPKILEKGLQVPDQQLVSFELFPGCRARTRGKTLHATFDVRSRHWVEKVRGFGKAETHIPEKMVRMTQRSKFTETLWLVSGNKKGLQRLSATRVHIHMFALAKIEISAVGRGMGEV